MLIHDALLLASRLVPDKTALIDARGRHSYAAIERASARLAATLHTRGVQRGDRVLLLLPNGHELVVAALACARLGAAFVPLHVQTKASKLAFVIDDTEPAALFAYGPLARVWDAALANANGARGVRLVITVGECSDRPATETPRLPWELAAFANEELVAAPTIDLDLAAILYTSGSTGEPKGVMLSHRNMVSAARSVQAYLGLADTDVIASALPMSFGYGLYQPFLAFQVGATCLVEPSFTFPVATLERMQAERATVFPAVPAMFATLFALPDPGRFDLSSLRIVTNAAAALSDAQLRDLRRLWPQARLFSMYGQTECKRISYLPPEDLERRPRSVGRGMPNQELWLVDENGRRLPPGSTGELVVRGSHVMMGYWRRPVETERKLRPGPYPGERVLHTGDIFQMDAEGYLTFVSRTDDIIKTRGEKVSPREIENVIHDVDGVADVAVVGVPDAMLGEAIKAYVVLKPGASCTARDLVRHCAAHLENYMVPRDVELVAELPMTNTGKVSRKALRDEARASAPAVAALEEAAAIAPA